MSVFVIGNDFDPDGDAFSVVEVTTPAHGTRRQRRQLRSTTHPTPASPASRPSPTPPRQPRPAVHWARRRCGSTRARVGAGVTGRRRRLRGRLPRRRRSGSPTADLLANDDDPQGQTLTVVAVSEPSNDGVLTGIARRRVHLHPEHRRRLRQHRPHDQLPRHRHRRPRRPRPPDRSASSPPATPTNHPSPRDDVARTDIGTDGVGVRDRQRLRSRRRRVQRGRGHHPRPRHASPTAATSSTTPPTPASPASRPSPTRSATATACSPPGTARCGSTRAASGARVTGPRRPTTRSSTKASSVGFTTAELLANDDDPQGQTLTVVAVSEPSNDGVLTGTLAAGFTYTPSTDAAFDRHRPLDQLPRHRHRRPRRPRPPSSSASSPPATPTNHPSPFRTRRVDRSARCRVFVIDNDFDPDGDSFSVVEVATPAHGTRQPSAATSSTTHPTAGFSGIETITYTPPRQPRPARRRAWPSSRSTRPATNRRSPSRRSYGVQAGAHAADHAVGGRSRRPAADLEPRHAAGRPADRVAVRRRADADLHGADQPGHRLLRLRGRATARSPRRRRSRSRRCGQRRSRRRRRHRDHDAGDAGRRSTCSTATPTPTATTSSVDRRHQRHARHGRRATSARCTYTPEPGFFGTDSFTYTIADGFGGADDRHRDGHRRPVADRGEPRRRRRPTTGPGATSIQPRRHPLRADARARRRRLQRAVRQARAVRRARAVRSSGRRSPGARRSPSSLRSPSARRSAGTPAVGDPGRLSRGLAGAAGRHPARRASRRRASRSSSSSRCTTRPVRRPRRCATSRSRTSSFFDGTPLAGASPAAFLLGATPLVDLHFGAPRRGAIGWPPTRTGDDDLRLARCRPDDDADGARRRRRRGGRCSPRTPICAGSRSRPTSPRSSTRPVLDARLNELNLFATDDRPDQRRRRGRRLAGGRFGADRRHPGRRRQPRRRRLRAPRPRRRLLRRRSTAPAGATLGRRRRGRRARSPAPSCRTSAGPSSTTPSPASPPITLAADRRRAARRRSTSTT